MKSKPVKGLLAGTVASLMLKGFGNYNPSTYRCENQGISFSLSEKGHSMLLRCKGAPHGLFTTWEKTYKVRAEVHNRAQHFLHLAVARMLQQWGAERIRRHAATMAQAESVFMVGCEEFGEWVDRTSAREGICSRFNDMTRDEAEKWIVLVRQWKDQNPVIVMAWLLAKDQ